MRQNSRKELLKLLFCYFVISILSSPSALAQNKKEVLADLLVGRWAGKVTIQNINRFGGWSGGRFLGFHYITKETWNLYFDVNFMHPLDDPSVIEEYKKMGIPVESIKNFMPVLGELRINGYATVSGVEEHTHETKEYCQECKGKDGTTKKEFPPVVFSVSGTVDLRENEINFNFENVPTEYALGFSHWFKSENIKFVEPDKILFDYETRDGEPVDLEQKLTGELYKINFLKKTFPKDIKPNEPIKTDKKTRIEITIPDVGKVNIAENTKAVFRSENLIEVVEGKIHGFIKKLKPKTKFEIHTPPACVGVRGTEYILTVEDDGTTTLIVLDGEVEFSDKEKRKAVLVKRNQQSVVKPGELPSEPENINPDRIIDWWK